MKILHVIHRFVDTSRRGSEIYTAALCRHLSGKHEVAVLYTSRTVAEGRVERSALNGLKTFVVGARASWEEAKIRGSSRRAERAFEVVLREWRPDVVHFQHLLFHSLRLPGIVAGAGIPSVLTLHDFWLLCPQINLLDHRQQRSWPIDRRKCVACCEASIHPQYSWRRLWGWEPSVLVRRALQTWYLRRRRPRLAARVFEDVDLFVAPSRHVRDRFIEEGLAPSKVTLCTHGIEHRLLSPKHHRTASPSEPLRCGFLGTIAPHKGLDVLLKAVEDLDGVTLDIYGAAPPEYLTRSYGRKVRFMGELAEAGKAAAYANMDVLVVPSIWFENSSLVTLEAFSFGVPVIASAIGALPEIVSDKRSGLLVRVGDAADLRAKIERIARDRSELARLGANVPAVKSTSEHTAEIEALYQHVLAERRTASPEG